MRAKITRLLATLMAVIMVLSFAACGGNTEDETTATKPSTTETGATIGGDEESTTEPSSSEEDSSSEENSSSEGTTKEDGKTTTKKYGKTTTKKDSKTTTKKDSKTTTKKDDKTTTKTTTKTTKTTTKPSTTKTVDKTPSTKAEILNAYKDAVAKVNSSKAGFTKTRKSSASKFEVPGVLSAFTGMIEGFMGIGSKNEYSVDVAKGTFGGKIKKDASGKDQAYYYLTNVKLTTSDIKSADCKKSGANYIITITLKDGTSQAGNGVSTKNNSPLDRSGLCVGDRDIDIFDHKTGEIMYSAIKDTAKKTTVTESTSNAKIVATVNASSGKLSNLKITFDLKCNMKINFLGNHDLEAAGATTVTYKNFKW